MPFEALKDVYNSVCNFFINLWKSIEKFFADIKDSLVKFFESELFKKIVEVVLIVIIGAIILIVLIYLCGFGAAGVLAGSLASCCQSIFYGGYIASGGLFSILQSVGAMGIKFLMTR